MRARLVLLASLALLLLAPLAAHAQPIEGLYVGAGVGANVPQNNHAQLSSTAINPWDLREKTGLGLDGRVGYGFPGGWRVELQGIYLRNPIQSPASAPGGGPIRTFGLMGNVLYDFDIRSRYVFPYLGLGAGYMWSRFDEPRFVLPGGGVGVHGDFSSGGFAWQAIAGLAFPVPNWPGLSITTEYRFLDVTSGETFDNGSIKLGPQYSHTFSVGVRYAFYVPRPAAPPAPTPVAAPAPAPARSYLVFFDWDKATLTTRARQIIREAADNSRRVQYTRIDVNGYTDTSGRREYNQKLSVRRAQNVAAELVRDGVPRNAIAIRGFGETHLLVPTGPGVREPQNRRVEIVIG